MLVLLVAHTMNWSVSLGGYRAVACWRMTEASCPYSTVKRIINEVSVQRVVSIVASAK